MARLWSWSTDELRAHSCCNLTERTTADADWRPQPDGPVFTRCGRSPDANHLPKPASTLSPQSKPFREISGLLETRRSSADALRSEAGNYRLTAFARRIGKSSCLLSVPRKNDQQSQALQNFFCSAMACGRLLRASSFPSCPSRFSLVHISTECLATVQAEAR